MLLVDAPPGRLEDAQAGEVVAVALHRPLPVRRGHDDGHAGDVDDARTGDVDAVLRVVVEAGGRLTAGDGDVTDPPATLRPSRRLMAVPAPVTLTPGPMSSEPLETAMPWPPVFWTVT